MTYPELSAVGRDHLKVVSEKSHLDDAIDAHKGQAKFAYRLAKRYADRLMHVHGIGWHWYDGKRWVEDYRGHAERAVLDEVRRALGDSFADPDLRRDIAKVESANGVAGTLRLAASLEQFAFTVDELDVDPYLLNCSNVTLNLQTMSMYPHRPADRITKVANGAYRPDEVLLGANWQRFLSTSLDDEDVRGFLQRYVGVGLVGKVLEHKLAILTGVGRNGKGVFYGALAEALGDYAATAEQDLFLHRDNAHPTGEMDLRGVRWVAVSESDRGRRLAEATVKRLTGGDKIKARRMRQDFVEFTPSHTAALVTNFLPKVSADDPALWARLCVVPFDRVIAPADRDPELPTKLVAESDAILAWALAGWRDYIARGGLDAPSAVVRETQAYQSGADEIGRFLAERCLTSVAAAPTKLSMIHQSWAAWATAEGVPPMSSPELRAALEKREFVVKKGAGNAIRVFGLVLASDHDE